MHPARDVSGVAHQYLYFTSGTVFNTAQGSLLKWSTQKETEGRIFNDVCVYFDRYVANLQGQVLGAPYHPISSAVRSLHVTR